MADIVLSTLNARWAHTAFGLRYLMANLGVLRARARLLEFEIADRPVDVVERILAEEPRIVGLGTYIWNVRQTTEVVALLRRLRPAVHVVLGGPEVSHGPRDRPLIRDAQHVIAGEADLEFAALCGRLLDGAAPSEKFIDAAPPALERLVLPYELYDEEDVARRVIYVEASRGCPFHCEFCLSALDDGVRRFDLARFLEAMQGLLDRGARRFKFVDRTFNLKLEVGRSILSFFLERYTPGLFLHFEMIPDRLPEPLCEIIRRFPPGSLQFEVGIQSFDPAVLERIRRRQDDAAVERNLRFLREHTGVHVHADLIVGLPGEDPATFAAGFDRLVALGPQEIQVGMLKRLHGAPIARHDVEWGMVYDEHAPYEIAETGAIDFATMQRLRRFARYWDLVANSGNFVETAPLLWGDGSPFQGFLAFSDWLRARLGRTHAIALDRLCACVLDYLVGERGLDRAEVEARLARDFRRGGRRGLPACLSAAASERPARGAKRRAAIAPPRQARHAGEAGSDSQVVDSTVLTE